VYVTTVQHCSGCIQLYVLKIIQFIALHIIAEADLCDTIIVSGTETVQVTPLRTLASSP